MVLEELKPFIKVVDTPLEVELEIPHLAYIEAKKREPKILLFTNPRDRGRPFEMPVVMNLFANREVVEAILGRPVEEIAKEIEELLKPTPPATLWEKVKFLGKLLPLRWTIPRRYRGSPRCQQQVWKGDEVDLFKLPVLKSWELDGGRFITIGQVYTRSLDGKIRNVGLYRLQLHSKNRLGLHWQIHKDGAHLFWEYKKAGKKMPVAVGIGGDPLYSWCATAPLPPGIFELALYGFIRRKPVQLAQCLTNPIEVPADLDIVIEGWCDPSQMEIEGMFGDHTGYYTLPEPFPVMEVTAITTARDPKYYATVVGKPPVEDKWLGYITERLFLPLLRTTIPDLVDYYLPENGVFHNLLLAKISPRYPGHSLQIAHALWGVGQMSFLKHAIFLPEEAPDLRKGEEVARFILNRFSPSALLISKGVVDQLDHSSDAPLVGGKVGVDATGPEVKREVTPLSDKELLKKMEEIDPQIVGVTQYFTDTANPVAVVEVVKREPMKKLFKKLAPLYPHLRIVIFINTPERENPYMLVWRVTNNIDGLRDIFIDGPVVGIDATNKGEIDNFPREWPPDVDPTPAVVQKLKELGLVELTDEELRKFQIV